MTPISQISLGGRFSAVGTVRRRHFSSPSSRTALCLDRFRRTQSSNLASSHLLPSEGTATLQARLPLKPGKQRSGPCAPASHLAALGAPSTHQPGCKCCHGCYRYHRGVIRADKARAIITAGTLAGPSVLGE